MPTVFKENSKIILITALVLILGLVVVFARFGAPLKAALRQQFFGRSTTVPVHTSPVVTTAATPTPESPKAQLQVIEGTVQLTGAVNAQLSEGAEQELTTNTTIITGASTLALIDYGQGTKVRLGPDSTVEFQQDTPAEPVTLVQWAGSVYVRFTKIIGVREQFTTETPTAVTTVRGTSWAQFVDPKTAETVVSVIESQVEVGQKNPATGEWIEGTAVKLDPDFETSVASPSAGAAGKPMLRLAAKRRTRAQTIRDKWLDFNTAADAAETTQSGQLRTLLRQRFTELYLRPLAIASPTANGATASAKPSPSPLPLMNSMPGVGLQRGSVKTSTGTFPLSCIGADKSTVKVVTDSGNDSTCGNDCAVLPLHEYATRNGGFAAMNGTYFCPADYPACAEKKNSFDTLFFNSRSRSYLNSDNNVYSVLPFLVINSDGSPRFINRTLEWGRDTGIQAGIAGHPMLVKDSQQVATADGLDTKQLTVKSNRGAFVHEGNNLYLCIVGSATVLDAAEVFSTLGADNAINIDGGGSSALWLNGKYIYGPGRQIPTAIIFARR